MIPLDCLKTTVFRKLNSNTYIITKYSRTTFLYKISAINTYIHRVLKICLFKDLLNIEINKIKEKDKNAEYPTKPINLFFESAISRYNIL